MTKSFEIKDDTRQEPPIPVERVLVTEKSIPKTEKSAGIGIPTLSPAVKEIVEEIKKLDPINLRNNEVREKDAYQVDAREEPVVLLKAEEKIKEIEMKDRTNEESLKDENLIHSDAIKKEESELRENEELAIVDAEEKHEELRKTLEKYKLEQQEMLQEQKKVLKDLREQKEEFEKEKKEKLAVKKLKQLESKNEIKKDEEPETKKIERDVPKLNLDKKNINSEKINNAGKGPNIPNDPAVLNSSAEMKKDPFNISNDHKNIVNIENVVQKNVEANNQIGGKNVIVENKPHEAMKGKKAQEIKNLNADVTEIKVLENSRGPILNALGKRKLRNDILQNGTVDTKNNEHLADNELQKDLKQNPDLNATVDDRLQETNAANLKHDHQLPIALIMNNKTKKSNKEEPAKVNKSEEGIMAIRRDILESHDREKRDAEKISKDFESEKIESFVKDIANKDDGQKCTKTDKLISNLDEKKNGIIEETVQAEKKSKEEVTTELQLIKTNAYLSEQGFTDGAALENNFLMSGEFAKSKQRNLKSLDSDDKNEKT